ncbi:uncharacterized protein C11orf98 homolog isoform X2 [Apteryx mantelli]|uniref:Uncharacterized protein C11orf98 homolog isoform X2 n=1 Tax=Apteryx mantelli TaxID=2696672 RepID=A0A8B7J9C0_9AVES|nr:PREDICTED: uncharacterized protein C11orf98 homolog isoform X2 [Apteryx mantelli mantelli]XP_025912124.1 uncharacterized protein C11orf98 homolog isoform X2 [Apteryx rowi]
MGTGGKINRPRTELKKKLFKRRRVLGREKRKKRRIVGAVVDEGLITVHHLRKRLSSPRANITLSGKKRRKLLKRLQHAAKEKAAMQVDAAPKLAETNKAARSCRKRRKLGVSEDVEMMDLEAVSEVRS